MADRDDGRGLPAKRRNGNGLTNMARRAARWDGTFDVMSSAAGGTTLRWEVGHRTAAC